MSELAFDSVYEYVFAVTVSKFGSDFGISSISVFGSIDKFKDVSDGCVVDR